MTTPDAERLERRIDTLVELAVATKGFMPADEGIALMEAAMRAGRERPGSGWPGSGAPHIPVSNRVEPPGATFVEIGAWCGKSTIYLGAAAEATGALLFSIDHHHGSEENQPGWEHHDPEVVDPTTGMIDTLGPWRRSVESAGLGESVVGIVGRSESVAAHWGFPVDFCFIDGGHGEEPAWADYRGWAPKVAPGGWLAIHDVFENPSDGGRPPYDIWRAALASGQFVEDGCQGSLRLLRRVRQAS